MKRNLEGGISILNKMIALLVEILEEKTEEAKNLIRFEDIGIENEGHK